MKTEDIRKMGLAYLQVLEGKKKLDPVDQDELKGTHAQRKDKDIDNDGDADSSDEYLHNRRKAISKKMKETDVVESDNTWPVYKRILEKRDEHTKGATPPEKMDDKWSGNAKKFVDMHGGLTGNETEVDGAKAAAQTAANATKGVKVAPKRPADQSVGDKSTPKS